MVKLRNIYSKYDVNGTISKENFKELLIGLNIILKDEHIDALCIIMKNEITYDKLKTIIQSCVLDVV